MLLVIVNKPTITYDIPIYVVFTILATLIAAMGAQIVSHFFSVRRDIRKEFMQKYQDLFSGSIAPISNYMAIKTNPRKLHDVHYNVVESDLLEIAIIKLQENIKYASPTLLRVYERYFGYGYHEDGWGSSEEGDKHALIYFLLDDLIRSSKRVSVFSKMDRRRLKIIRYYYGVCAMALNFFEMDDSEQILQMEYFYKTKKVKYKNLNKVLYSLDRSKMAKHLLKHVSVLKKSDKGNFKEIIDTLKRFKTK
ncbi:hypothetical protein CHR53_26425 [Neobacillus mesonae]|uniref:Uncharacterized protein n=2 Tax=Neobacillus mesonae TaxID=1193713 RepID=A0A3Q9R200_9BACI|nr:hypothetical protein CHR53_26425 [Neobacillus mesonae]